ncbi:MAG: short-chain dehydrogenase, partial [bacterium]
MEISGSKVLMLGGWGMVGMAICRKLLEKKPRTIIISSLTRSQAEEAVKELQPLAGNTELIPAWGNIFVRDEFKDLSRSEILEHPQRRILLAEDILERTTSTTFEKFFLYRLITHHRPQIIIDCVNTATGVAYQDIYTAGLKVLEGVKRARKEGVNEEFLDEVEKLLGTLYIPQLVRHVQVIHSAMVDAGVRSYLKVGTSGTGGMGLNIPYTHSEDRPSRVLLSKSSIAGAHTLLLYLMARTPEGPYVKEVKPTTAIAWKRITKDKVWKGGKPVSLYDCPPERATILEGEILTYDPQSAVPLNREMIG